MRLAFMPISLTGRASVLLSVITRRWQRTLHTRQEFLLDSDRFGDDRLDKIRMRTALEVTEKQTGEVGVHSLVTADELVGKGKTRHQTSLLKPEDGGKRSRKENAFHG